MFESILPSTIFGSIPDEASKTGKVYRRASPSEKRCIYREIGWYNALVIGGVYHFTSGVDLTAITTYAPALGYCISELPQLSAVVERTDTEAPIYVQVPELNLHNHIEILNGREWRANSSRPILDQIQDALPSILDAKWATGIPAWKLLVLPLSEVNGTTAQQRCFIGFLFAHSFGDGMNGIIFQKKLLAALNDPSLTTTPNDNFLRPASGHPFSEPFDTPGRLPISWSFLLAPFLAVYLPKPISAAFGLRATSSTVTPTTWTAKPYFYDADNHRTAARIITIDPATVSKTLMLCRQHKAKITGLLHQFILRALSQCLPADGKVDNFVSQTAINMRGAAGAPNDIMGLFVSGYYGVHSRLSPSQMDNATLWEEARLMSNEFAKSATRLSDQPIGLLRFLPSIRNWTLSKLGQQRDASYEISNLLAFDATVPPPASGAASATQCQLEDMIFAQPANVTGSPLAFSVVSVKGGSLVATVSWQVGALEMPEEGEKAFVENVCQSIETAFRDLA